MTLFPARLRALPKLFLALAALPAPALAGELRLYLMPTYPVKLSWDSPRELLTSTLKAVPLNGHHAIGHVSVEVNCGGTSSTFAAQLPEVGRYLLSGAVPSIKSYTGNLLLLKRVGFSVLEMGWPGKVESPKDVLRALRSRNGDPRRLSVLTYLVSDRACQRLLDFHREYSAAAPALYYGNAPRPRLKEGSGCSAFGTAFLEVAGLMTERLRHEWITRVRVPQTLMAGYQGRKKVSIRDILRSPASREWAREEDPHMDLETFDPDRMHLWARRLAASPAELRARGGELDTALPHGLRGVPAIKFDFRDAPVPTEPIFQGKPKLKKLDSKSVVRADKVASENGSFPLRP